MREYVLLPILVLEKTCKDPIHDNLFLVWNVEATVVPYFGCNLDLDGATCIWWIRGCL